MSQTTSHNSDTIQEFYAPRVEELIQQTRPQQTQRPVQLSDIAEHSRKEEEETPGCLGSYKAGDEFRLFWSWVDDFLAKRKAKQSTNATANTLNPRKETAVRSSPSQSTPRPYRSSVASSMASIEREAQYTARKEMLEYEVARYSLWGEIVYHYKAWRLKKAKKQADAERQGAREEEAKYQMAQAANAAPKEEEEESFQPGRYRTLASPTLEIHPTLARQIDNMDPNALPPLMTKKPAPSHTRNKSSGEVSKHTVKINQLPPVHKSVHLSEGPWNSQNGQEELPQRKDRNSSVVTAFGDFIRRPSKTSQLPTERLTKVPSHIPVPPDLQQPDPLRPTFYQQVRKDSLPETINERRESGEAEHQRCGLCGSLNSPNTHYGDQGVWLCSACRNPTFSTERPPSSFSVPRKEKATGQRTLGSRFASREHIKASKDTNNFDSKNRNSPSPDPVSPLSPTFPSSKPAPLRLNKNNMRRPDTPVSPMSTDPFSNFDSSNSDSYTTNPSTPPHDSRTGSETFLPPRPYPKDRVYISLSDSRLSFYPNTPTSTAPNAPRKDSDTLPPIPTPPSSSNRKGKQLPSFPPAPPPLTKDIVAKNPRFPIRSSSLASGSTPTPRAESTPAQFPFAPPPIPDETVHRPMRSSSIYPEDLVRRGREERDTYMLPALQFDGRGTLANGRSGREGSVRSGKSVKRDTGFYDFWNPILEDR